MSIANLLNETQRRKIYIYLFDILTTKYVIFNLPTNVMATFVGSGFFQIIAELINHFLFKITDYEIFMVKIINTLITMRERAVHICN